jgi:hypothetical protein
MDAFYSILVQVKPAKPPLIKFVHDFGPVEFYPGFVPQEGTRGRHDPGPIEFYEGFVPQEGTASRGRTTSND